MDDVSPSPDELRRAAAILRDGGLVAFPTETVYGLGADAANARAVQRIFTVKGRPADHPLIVHLGGAAALGEWARDVPDVAWSLAERFWPGPLTMILARTARVPDIVTGGRDTVGLRVPDHPVALALLDAFGGGLAAPSANRFGRVSPTTAADVQADLGDDVDLVLDGGPCAVGVESTILDLTTTRPEILRPGGVGVEALAEVLGEEPAIWEGHGAARAPGMLAAHYAPSARVVLVSVAELSQRVRDEVGRGRTVGVLAPAALDRPSGAKPDDGSDVDADLHDHVIELEPAGDAEHFAQVLYARLRQADRLGVEVLIVVPPEERGVGRAVRDRLQRAAASSDPGT